MGRQAPKLLSRVIRAITSLKEQKGSTVSSIVTHVRNAISESDDAPRNITMQVRRALRHAVDNGLVVQRAGKYRVVGRNRLVPVDSLEMAVDCKRKKRTVKKKQAPKCPCKRRRSHHDYAKKGLKSQHRRKGKNKAHAKTPQSQKKGGTVSNAGSQSSVHQKQQQQQQQEQQEQQQQQHQDVTPSASDTNRKSVESYGTSRSPERKTNNDGQRRETPFPDSCTDGSGSPPVRKKKGRRFRRAPIPPPNANHNPDVSPTVEEEPMDSSGARTGSIPRNETPRRVLDLRQQEDTNESDSLQE